MVSYEEQLREEWSLITQEARATRGGWGDKSLREAVSMGFMLRKCLPTTQSASREDWHLPSPSLARYSRGWLPPPWADVLAVEED